MRVLFAISVLCLCAVLWVAVSIARHVLATWRRRQPSQRAQEGFVEIFFDDKMQQIREHAAIARQAGAMTGSSSWMSAPLRPEFVGVPSAQSAYQRPSAQPVAPAVASPVPAPLVQTVSAQSTVADLQLPRKAPQPATANGLHRADWDYFNKDLGDLTDPYEDTLRDRSEPKSGTRY